MPDQVLNTITESERECFIDILKLFVNFDFKKNI